jgi:hypothetical protein
MQRNNPRTLTAAFLLVSFALSIALLAARNLYDDEIASLPIITSSLKHILEINAHSDVHPPGMYLLTHIAYLILPSFRWMNLFPGAVTYAGLAVFLFQVTPLFARTRSQLCLLLLATLHPQLLMWGATFRWYGWWTGLALITLTIALQPRNPRPALGATRALTLGLLLACLFYLNYITFLFAFALAAAMLLRYRTQFWKHLLVSTLLIVAVFAALIAPHLHTMLAVHLPASRTQRSGLAASFLRLLQSIAVSEAYLPWHPLAILAGLFFAALCVRGLILLLRLYRAPRSSELPPAQSEQPITPLASLALFGLLFFLLVAATGIGGKPRSGLLLIPVLAPIAAWIVGTLRPRVQDAILFFIAIWSAVGAVHMLGRYGLTKTAMTDRPEQVAAFVQQTAGPACAVVVTYDAELAFTLAQSNLPRLLIISPFGGPIFGGSRTLPSDCTPTILYAVESYMGGDSEWARTLHAEIQSSTKFIQSQPQTSSFSFDPDAARKRSLARIPGLGGDLASAARLPDYRYVVTSGPIDPASLNILRSRLPDFVSESERTAQPVSSK